MKSRTVHATRSGDLSTKYRLKIVDDPSLPDTEQSERRLLALLREVSDQPALLMCGPVMPKKLSIYHNGTALVLEAEAEVYNTQPQQS